MAHAAWRRADETKKERSDNRDGVWPSVRELPVGVPSADALRSTSFAERYEIAELLGAGGMGEVRRARDRHLARDVAVKIQHGDDLDTVLVARFEREARVQGQSWA